MDNQVPGVEIPGALLAIKLQGAYRRGVGGGVRRAYLITPDLCYDCSRDGGGEGERRARKINGVEINEATTVEKNWENVQQCKYHPAAMLLVVQLLTGTSLRKYASPRRLGLPRVAYYAVIVGSLSTFFPL